MIEQLYLDLAEETNDQKFYGKLFKSCQAATEQFLGQDEVGGTLVTYFTVLHRQNYT